MSRRRDLIMELMEDKRDLKLESQEAIEEITKELNNPLFNSDEDTPREISSIERCGRLILYLTLFWCPIILLMCWASRG